MAKKIIIENIELGDSGIVSKDKINNNFRKTDNVINELDGDTVKKSSITSILGPSSEKIPSEQAVSNALKEYVRKVDAELGIILKGDKANVSAIKATSKPKRGDTYKALDTGHYWTYDGSGWNDIGEIIPSDIFDRPIIREKAWLKNKYTEYTKAELGAISRIFNIKVLVYDEIKDTDIFSVCELYVQAGLGVINIFRNGVSYLRRINVDINAQRYTDDKIDFYYDFTIPVSGNLNTAKSHIILSPSCIYKVSKISDSDRLIIREKAWLKNKNTNYIQAEVSAIKRISDIKIYVSEKNDTDIYTVNILRIMPDGTQGQIAIWKNGAKYIIAQLDLSKQHYLKNGYLELWYDFTQGSLNKNSVTSQIVLSDSAILLFSDYYLSIGYELIERYTDQYGNITSATVRWGDGSSGVYTATYFNSSFLCYDGYKVQHADTYKTLQQQKVTRNSIGTITNKPKLTVY